jgi:hypothetical protein
VQQENCHGRASLARLNLHPFGFWLGDGVGGEHLISLGLINRAALALFERRLVEWKREAPPQPPPMYLALDKRHTFSRESAFALSVYMHSFIWQRCGLFIFHVAAATG